MMNQEQWLNKSLRIPTRSRYLSLQHKQIHIKTWGQAHHPKLIFLHGGFANAEWFTCVAPHFADQFYVMAPDFPGHGHSDWFDRYDHDLFKAFMDTLIAPSENIVVIGHSMGGIIALNTLKHHKHCQLILVDTPYFLRFNQPKSINVRSIKYYDSEHTLLDRFRIMPSQPCINPSLQNHIASKSITHSKLGYRWLFDPNFFTHAILHEQHETDYHKPFTILYGEHTTVTDQSARQHYSRTYPNTVFKMVPNAYHAVNIDQPELLTQMIHDIIHTSSKKSY
ncbi:MAG: alpha/beta hydrolase [Pseudomonadota bacterium]|nr:alpha/beta hydrolase [Pseudomonadota bacterium]